MFPINLCPWQLEYVIRQTLHSTMFPINRGAGVKPGRRTSPLYIPLCFLLIPPCTHRRTSTLRTLHSTMFPINRRRSCCLRCTGTALHSTMFPINRQTHRNSFLLNHLYIPLCFLLIAAVALAIVSDQTSLHSTMFPINRDLYQTDIADFFTLHSTMFPINHS